MVIVGAFPKPIRGQEPRAVPAVLTPVDGRLCHIFEASRRYVRRRRQRRYLQIALATCSFLFPVAALLGEDLVTPTVLMLGLGAWATLIGLTHVSIMSEWRCYLRTARSANEVREGPVPSSWRTPVS